ncbi:hypothetical protein AM493_19190 [Flavobacterium akiainvivens]|uniref:Uncharacterized protein n=1 Tax=Flavobacterium akiainvivens TaxID=1202724 RepID=A0A0M8MBW5_9FLAO|nr:hypothetical protein [Flavobacterium akiainvivens]KOS07943.1 hypothetical protein AM493_19190 [Flavobacterium akiainvivens]SFQ29377.1 hypothetical protein SAMN05444144_102420 [Flavobacterium akiainvivens]
MKKLVLVFAILFALPAVAQTDNGWEEWQKTSCYSHIQFRLKFVEQRGEQYVWKVQFKNTYSNLISFSYHVTDEPGDYSLTTHRKVLEKGATSGEVEVFTAKEDIFLVVDKVSFSAYPTNYVDCDQ